MTFALFAKKALFRLRGVMTMHPIGKKKGHVLLSHDTTAFFMPEEKLGGHAHYWTASYIAQSFLKRGYEVDIIDWQNEKFTPRKTYDFFYDIHANMERLAPLLGTTCVKILQCSGAHWLFQNTAEYTRCLALQKRRNKTVYPLRLSKPNYSIEAADHATYFGNEFASGTYRFAGKPMHSTPIPSTHTFPSPEKKDFASARKNFVWFGGAGAVHKGLDLVLEAFAGMPEYNLTIGGKWYEKDFEDAYHHELTELPNIKTFRYLDPEGPEFKAIVESSVAIVYPSCSEGSAGSVVDCMQAGLIPVVSFETGVNTGSYGITLKENTIEAIQNGVREIATLTPEELKKRAVATWEYTRTHHTPKVFAAAFDALIDSLEKKRN